VPRTPAVGDAVSSPHDRRRRILSSRSSTPWHLSRSSAPWLPSRAATPPGTARLMSPRS